MKALEPVPAGANGRSTTGQFSSGNSFGMGNPTARHVQKLRQLFVHAVTEDDMKEIVRKLVELAKGGDIQAANLLLTRVLGKPSTADSSLPLDDPPLSIKDQIAELGPVTADNLAEHKRLRIAFLYSKD